MLLYWRGTECKLETFVTAQLQVRLRKWKKGESRKVSKYVSVMKTIAQWVGREESNKSRSWSAPNSWLTDQVTKTRERFIMWWTIWSVDKRQVVEALARMISYQQVDTLRVSVVDLGVHRVLPLQDITCVLLYWTQYLVSSLPCCVVLYKHLLTSRSAHVVLTLGG